MGRLSIRPRSLQGADFSLLWAGQTVSELGSQVTTIALPLAAILVLHASAFAVGVLTSVEFLPFLLFGALAGAWADRLESRRVMIVADLGRAAALSSLPIAYGLGDLTMPQLYVVGFVAGSLTVLFACAYASYLPALLGGRQLLEANAKLEMTNSVARTAGPGVGGGLVSLLTAPVAILADAASFVVSALTIFATRFHEEPKTDRRHGDIRTELREGIGYVWGHPIFRANLFSAGLANLSYGVVWAVLLLFAVRVLHLHAGLIGLVLSLASLGGVLGSTLSRPFASWFGVGPTLIGAIACCGPAVLIVALAEPHTAIPLLVVGWGLWSFLASITAVLGGGIRQALVPLRLQGRVIGANRTIIIGVTPLGALAGGGLATAFGLRDALIAGAITSSVAFVPLALSPARRLRTLPEAS